MHCIVWLEQHGSRACLVKGGAVRAYWEAPSGLEAALDRAPCRVHGDVVVLSSEAMTLHVTLPVAPGLEPKDPKALAESLRWEAEPLLGFSPEAAPFAFARAGTPEVEAGGSTWWVTALEPGICEAWHRVCASKGLRLAAVMDPWAALASCRPEGNHLLVHPEKVILYVMRSGTAEVFRAWSRAPAGAAGDTEWLDEVLSSGEWNGITGAVEILDLEGGTDLPRLARVVEDQSGLSIREVQLQGEGHPPWTVLLASRGERLARGDLPLPAAILPRGRGVLLQALEGTGYTFAVLALLGALALGFYRDTVQVCELREKAAEVSNELSLRKGWQRRLSGISDRIDTWKKEVQHRAFRGFLRAFPARILDLVAKLDFDRNQLWLDTFTFEPAEKPGRYEFRIEGVTHSNAVFASVSKQFAGLLADEKTFIQDFRPDGPFEDGVFAFVLTLHDSDPRGVAKK